jgi:hypothetical protein
MTAAQLFAALRGQLADAAKPGLAGVRALSAATETLTALEDEYALMQKRWADKECVRRGHILRHAATPEQIYAATHAARAEHPEAWEGVRE